MATIAYLHARTCIHQSPKSDREAGFVHFVLVRLLSAFAVGFPIIIFAVFALFLWFKPQALYPPTDYRRDLHPQDFAAAMRSGARERPDVVGPVAQSPPSIETDETLKDSLRPAPPHASSTGGGGSVVSDPFFTMMDSFFRRKLDEAEDAYEDLQANERDAEQRLFYEALYLNHRYERGDASALSKLHDLAETTTKTNMPLVFLGHCYRYTRDYNQARRIYERAHTRAATEVERVNAAVLVAHCDRDLNEIERGIELISGLFVAEIADDSKRRIYEALAGLEESRGNQEMHALARDMASHYDPGDVDLRFSAAYALSDAGLKRPSVINYNVLLRFAPQHAAALNNLAVDLTNMGLRIKAVSLYRKAVDEKETLAMANLAFRYLDAGFEDHASELLDRAKSETAVHENVGHALVALNERRGNEEKRFKDVIGVAEKEQRFLQAYTEVYYTPPEHAPSFSGTWVHPDGLKAEFEEADDRICSSWETKWVKHIAVGKVHNGSARITLTREMTGQGTLLSYMPSSRQEGYVFLAGSGNEMRVMTMANDVSEFLLLRRL